VVDTEKARLDALHALNVLETAQEERFDRLTRIAARVFNAPIALVSLVDGDRQWFKSRQGLDVCETPRSLAFCEHAVRSRELVLVPDATKDDRFKDNPLVTGDPNIRFYAGAPLFSSCGRYVLGTLCVIDTIPRLDTEPHLPILEDLAATASHELAAGHAREQMEHALSGLDDERSLHRLVIENMPATLAVINTDLTYKLINQSFSQFSHTMLRPGMRMRDVLGEERFAIIEPYLKRALDGHTVHFEAASTDKNGEPVNYEIRYQPNFDAHGNVISLTSLGTDVTRRRRLESSIAALARMHFGATANLAENSQDALGRVADLLNMRFAGIMRRSPTGQFESTVTHAPDGFQIGGMPVAKHLMRQVVSTGDCVAIEDVRIDPSVSRITPGKFPIRAFAGAPIVVNDQVIGGVGFANTAPHTGKFLDLEIEVVRLAGSIIAREIARTEADEKIARRERELHELATTDPLTNLPNRRELLRRGQREVDRAERYATRFSFAIIDIDHFKAINDGHGHATGDLALVETANILKSAMRAVDCVGRIGGEEFAILMPETLGNGALDAMEKIRREIETHTYFSKDMDLSITASFGVATHQDGESLEDVMSRADQLLYLAKQSGRNQVRSDLDTRKHLTLLSARPGEPRS